MEADLSVLEIQLVSEATLALVIQGGFLTIVQLVTLAWFEPGCLSMLWIINRVATG